MFSPDDWEEFIEEDIGPSDEIPVYPGNGRLVVTLMRDFIPVDEAIAELGRDSGVRGQEIFSDQPFRRRAVIGSLLQFMGVSEFPPCCPVEESLPATLVESPGNYFTRAAGEPDPAAAARQAFGAYCATCHAIREGFPSNFLHGDHGSIGNSISHCAQRIAYRLAMWEQAGQERNKTPMPPASYLQSVGLSTQDWRDSESFATLGKFISDLLAITGSSAEQVEFIGGQAYQDLRPCIAKVD